MVENDSKITRRGRKVSLGEKGAALASGMGETEFLSSMNGEERASRKDDLTKEKKSLTVLYQNSKFYQHSEGR